MITIKRELIKDIYEKAYPLFQEHVEELAVHKEVMKLKPNVAKYQFLEDSENLIALFVYKDEELIGYSVNFILDNIHYSDLIYVQNDLIFIKKEYRGASIGSQLIKATEEEAFKEGADILLLHAKADTKLEEILPNWGYQVQDIIYSKVL